MSRTMKAAVFEKPGVITVKQVPVPEIGDDEVLIRVKLTGICGTDWSIYTGKYSADKLPLIAGPRVLRRVEQLGRNAKGPQGRRPRHRRHQHELRPLLLLQARPEASLPRVHAARHPHQRNLRRVREGALGPGPQDPGQAQLHARPPSSSRSPAPSTRPRRCRPSWAARWPSSAADWASCTVPWHGFAAARRSSSSATTRSASRSPRRWGRTTSSTPRRSTDPVAEVKRAHLGSWRRLRARSGGNHRHLRAGLPHGPPRRQVSAFGITGDKETMALRTLRPRAEREESHRLLRRRRKRLDRRHHPHRATAASTRSPCSPWWCRSRSWSRR